MNYKIPPIVQHDIHIPRELGYTIASGQYKI